MPGIKVGNGLCLLVFGAFYPSIFFGSEIGSVDLVRPMFEKSTDRINGLRWKDQPPKLVINEANGKFLSTAILEGEYDREEWALIWNEKTVMSEHAPLGKRNFSLEVPLQFPITPVSLKAVDARGQTETEVVLIVAASAPRNGSINLQYKASNVRPKRHFFSASTSLTTIDYQETGMSNFVESALTLKVAYQYLLVPRRWDIGLNAFYTAVPLNTSTGDATLRYLGLNARIGYVIRGIPHPWKLTVMAGGYFLTTYVTHQAFGFKDMYGPQLFPVIQREIFDKGTLSFYLKFSPILKGASPTFESRELAVGGNWAFHVSDQNSISISLDISQLNVVIPDVLTVKSSSTSLGLGIGW